MTESSAVTRSPKAKIIKLSIFLVVVISLILFVVFFSSRMETQAQYRGGKVVGQPVPQVKLVAMDGAQINLQEYLGKTVFINFFNSWCIPCREEEPALAQFALEHSKDEDFVFIGIVRDDSRENIVRWANERHVPFTIAFDVDESASISFGTTGQPETYAINRDGIVVASLLSRASVDVLNEMWEATQ